MGEDGRQPLTQMNEFSNLVQMSVDDLLIELAEESVLSGLSLGPEQKKKIGLAIFESMLKDIRAIICPKRDSLTSSADSDDDTKVRDAAFVMDMLLGLKGHPPVATLSMLVVKYGVERVCGD
jgi:hypothetical protein